MAANARRGEVEARLDGKSHRLCLTLGALAELENTFQAEDLNALAQRFSSGRLSARDMTHIVGAGLRGGGADVRDEDVAAMRHDDGLTGMARTVAQLLTVTFGAREDASQNP